MKPIYYILIAFLVGVLITWYAMDSIQKAKLQALKLAGAAAVAGAAAGAAIEKYAENTTSATTLPLPEVFQTKY